jgi:hypothetical protein
LSDILDDCFDEPFRASKDFTSHTIPIKINYNQSSFKSHRKLKINTNIPQPIILTRRYSTMSSLSRSPGVNLGDSPGNLEINLEVLKRDKLKNVIKQKKLKEYNTPKSPEIIAEDKVIENNIDEYYTRQAGQDKHKIEYYERIKKDKDEQIAREERAKKLIKYPLTNDHNGKVLVIK